MLINLIPRLLESPPESVFLDGVPLRDYPLAQLRQSIGYVPQETFLFSDSLAGNIAFGVEKIERAEIEWAAEIAGLSEDIRGFPDGFDTLVGERGITLSGGQKQRTAIARAVARSPRILILDDACRRRTLTMEEKKSGAVVRRDARAHQLIVSHRISTVARCGSDLRIDEAESLSVARMKTRSRWAVSTQILRGRLLEEELAAS
jgi:ATP-binding cassette subfamily B protein